MIKKQSFDAELVELAGFARVISHPARLAILRFLSESSSCITGDISDSLPLSKSTVTQHLKELKSLGLIQGDVDGLKVNYCLKREVVNRFTLQMNRFFDSINNRNSCDTRSCNNEYKE